MKTLLVLTTLALMLAGCGAGESPSAPTPQQREIRNLAAQIESIHPNPYHAIPRKRFRAEVERLAARAPRLTRPQLVVGLMRIATLLGERDGHSGIFALDPEHARELHAYPFLTYWFPDGLYVIRAPSHPNLVGAKLVAVGGRAVDQVVAKVAPLVPRDNRWTRMLRLPAWLVCAEVLEGLGITRGGPVRFDFDGGRSATLRPVPASEYVATIGYEHQLSRPNGAQPLWLSGLDESQYVRTIDDGRALYVGYHHTFEATDQLAERVLAAGRSPEIRRIVVDVRMNGGGNNQTYRPLLRALATPGVARKAYVLLGRVTFSAAGNFVTEVDLRTKATLVGEPSGGAPNQWGDNELVPLPRAGLTVRVANSYWIFGRGPKDRRVAVRPDIPVAMTAADFFAGRDPVLERALR
jgi:hypothetical protein